MSTTQLQTGNASSLPIRTMVLSESNYLVAATRTQPHRPGLYLELMRGRLDPEEGEAEANGPMIGPLAWMHTICSTHVILCFERLEDAKYFFSSAHEKNSGDEDTYDLFIENGFLGYDDCYFGDWSAIQVRAEDLKAPTYPASLALRPDQSIQSDIDAPESARGGGTSRSQSTR